MKIKLTFGEVKALLSQNPKTSSDGGFQKFLVTLASRVDDESGELELTDKDLAKINKYATEYGRGGFQSRLHRIFGRTLGKQLGWDVE